MAQYMNARLGEEFDGVISSVTSYGFFVLLPNTVEGLVHVSSMMDDYYEFDEQNYCLRGQDFGKTYHLGDTVRIQVTGVDMNTKSIDFCIIPS